MGQKPGTFPNLEPRHEATQEAWGFCPSIKEWVNTKPRGPLPSAPNPGATPTSQS